MAGALSFSATPTYVLTVSATWGESGSDTVTVNIAVTPEIGEASVSSSPVLPSSGDTVTLTAEVEAAEGIALSYQWQVKNGDSWSNLGAASTSSATTVTSAARAVKEYRVVVSHASGASETSSSEFVVWDEMAILGDFLTALDKKVVAAPEYKNAESAYLECINSIGLKLKSFDEVLLHYVSIIQTKSDSCENRASNPTRMFATYESVLRNKIAELKGENTLYAAFFQTPWGQDAERFIVNIERIKEDAAYAAVPPPGIVTGTSTAPPPTDQRSGLTCVPTGDNTNLSLAKKLTVLNCLTFQTPHSFWENDAEPLGTGIGTNNRYNFLGKDTWDCSVPVVLSAVDAATYPVAICKGHDVAVGSLQKFDEQDSSTELDKTWNPRNKHLADDAARLRMSGLPCTFSNPTVEKERICRQTWNSKAAIFFLAIAKINHKN